MESNKDLLKSFSDEFEKLKKELSLEVELENLDEVFQISDAILERGFVSKDFSRQIRGKMVETLMNWQGYLHALLMPNPSYMVNQNEANLFKGAEDKEKIWDMVKKIMALVNTSYLASVSKDKKVEREFIDGAYNFWVKEYQGVMQGVLEKIKNAWENKI